MGLIALFRNRFTKKGKRLSAKTKEIAVDLVIYSVAALADFEISKEEGEEMADLAMKLASSIAADFKLHGDI